MISATPPPTAKAHLIDFSPLPSYTNLPHYALIIDNFLTAAECASLISLAEATPNASWTEPALINTGYGTQQLMKDVRDCGRIMRDDREVAAELMARLRGFVEGDVGVLEGGGKWGYVLDRLGGSRGERWVMTRLNERLRFLRYTPGGYFKTHCDGSYVTPDRSERSFLTFHLYLSPGSSENKGGATRFYGRGGEGKMDVEPKQGRVLVFQHSGLWHSGETLESGVKITMRTDIMFREEEEDKKT